MLDLHFLLNISSFKRDKILQNHLRRRYSYEDAKFWRLTKNWSQLKNYSITWFLMIISYLISYLHIQAIFNCLAQFYSALPDKKNYLSNKIIALFSILNKDFVRIKNHQTLSRRKHIHSLTQTQKYLC